MTDHDEPVHSDVPSVPSAKDADGDALTTFNQYRGLLFSTIWSPPALSASSTWGGGPQSRSYQRLARPS